MINPHLLSGLNIAPVERSYGPKDVILYALGLGYGATPSHHGELSFVFERDVKVVPSICSVLCRAGPVLQQLDLGIDWTRVVHVGEAFSVQTPIPPAGTVRGHLRITGMEDKGIEKGCLLYLTTKLYRAEDGVSLATIQSTLLLRGNGGQGSFGIAAPDGPGVPSSQPDQMLEYRISPRAALIYRLSGDMNPLHVDPKAARLAGFDRPILHGLCISGMACRAILSRYCDDDPRRLTAMSVRFSRPAYPEETLRFEIYERGAALVFRARVVERDVVVLDHCNAALAVTRRQ